MKKFVWWTVLVILLLSRTFAVAADQTMLQKAKKEGKVAFYANITAVAPIMTDFGNRYGVKAEYTRLSATKFVATIMTEHAAGKLAADVLQAPVPEG